MSISRLTRQRLYNDEALFNNLLPYVKWDKENQVFLHSDASIWSIWYLKPVLLTSISDAAAFQTCAGVQELVDSMDCKISVQFSWITSFDVHDILDRCLYDYPLTGVAGWMSRRWVKMLKNTSRSNQYARRPKKLRLVVAFRYDPPWTDKPFMEKFMDTIKVLINGTRDPQENSHRSEEYKRFVGKFRGEVDGKVSRFSDLSMHPTRIDGQGLIDLLYPLLNRRSTKGGKFKRGRFNAVAVPKYDSDDILANQISDTITYHPENGFIIKDGRCYHTISMVKPPKQCLPLMTVPMQSLPMESVFTVTYSKDPQEDQLKRLDKLDKTLGLREMGALGRANQKVLHQISTIRQARE
ncbi:MAG: TraC family protein, partial [Proteobacteria bacterium]|nr:TraC family protein [Pseudomonadota bacterium]